MKKLNQHRAAGLLALTLIAGTAVSCSNNNTVVILDDSAPATPAAAEESAGAATVSVEAVVSNETANEEKSNDGYEVVETIELFNGKDLSGWANETGGEPTGWTVEDGILRLVDPQNGGDLLTKESFDNYVLSFDWRFGVQCNSGVKYKIEQPNGKGWIGLEYQVQDDANVDDGKIDDRKIASLFDVLPAAASSKAADYPAPTTELPEGAFRSGKILVLGNHVEHWIDGEKVLAFDIGSEEWNAAKADSKFKNQKNFGLVNSSPILLQCHGYPVDYRNVVIQKIKAR